MQYYHLLERIEIQKKRTDNLETTLIHAYCCMLMIVSLIMYILLCR
jgi:DNA-directed RNA polymerase subunit N (RpoN/RPB10)